MKTILLFITMIISILPLQGSDKLVFTSIENSGFTAFATKVVTQAYKNIGIDISVKALPGKRALIVSNQGKGVDGELFRISGVEKTYTNLIPIKVALHKSQWMVYTKNKDFKVQGWQSLKPYKIGIKRGIATTEKGTQGMKTTRVNSNEQLFKLLDTNRVDLIVISKINGKKYLDNSQYKDIDFLETPVAIISVYHFLHIKNQHLVPKITQAMKELEEQGIIEKLKKK